ncbi:hypothetical protein KN10_1854 [Anoxybacillus flavithermus NBRC 109594]|uniref:Uncharacterized protein n=1 Tax=Anoxybacillus flavithermus NBRC 109594 TaxID=1315967 RepID=R4G0Z4_9BACL|nr:hypothetical protein KN10_1854 [Anoxybacillus flavithermus NBRC 109594]
MFFCQKTFTAVLSKYDVFPLTELCSFRNIESNVNVFKGAN